MRYQTEIGADWFRLVGSEKNAYALILPSESPALDIECQFQDCNGSKFSNFRHLLTFPTSESDRTNER
jgi:hypothetical protein